MVYIEIFNEFAVIRIMSDFANIVIFFQGCSNHITFCTAQYNARRIRLENT